MSESLQPSNEPFDASSDAFTPMVMSSSDPVLGYPASELGYPATEPASIDLGPVPSGVGAKASAKTAGNDTSHKSPPIRNTEARSGPPLPKRPKGRLFIGSVFILVVVGLGTTMFNALLRYTAYGEVVGRRIELAAPWPGVIQSLHVREGDDVRFGDMIARIDSLELRQRIDEIDDSLRLQRAQLSSELAMLRWEAEKIRDIRKLAQSEFYDKWSELLWEQSKLADVRMQLSRLEPLHREGAASEEQLESLRFQFAGQEKRVEQLTEAVRALKHRSEDSPIELDLEDRVQPTLARIENLQAELKRTRTIIQQGEIRAPAAGRIVRTHRFAGEFAEAATPVVELLVEGSTELVLYLPQSKAKDYPVGRAVTVNVNPTNTSVCCEVHRVAMEMQPAPMSLARYYQSEETLLPVYLRVTDREAAGQWLTLGSELRLPRTDNLSAIAKLRRWWDGNSPTQPQRIPQPTRPAESMLPVRTASEQEYQESAADKEFVGTDGRTAGWIEGTNPTRETAQYRSTSNDGTIAHR